MKENKYDIVKITYHGKTMEMTRSKALKMLENTMREKSGQKARDAAELHYQLMGGEDAAVLESERERRARGRAPGKKGRQRISGGTPPAGTRSTPPYRPGHTPAGAQRRRRKKEDDLPMSIREARKYLRGTPDGVEM